MNGVSQQWNVDNDLFIQHLNRLATHRLEALKVDIGEYMVGQIQDRFDTQRLWDRSAMPQSAAAKERGGQTLILNRLLYKSYVYQPTASGVDVGSDSPYARIHHNGGQAGRGGKTTIIARPVLGVNDTDQGVIGNMILNDLRGVT